MISVTVNGQDIDGFLSIELTKSFLDLSAEFSIESINTRDKSLKFKAGDKIVMSIGETDLLTGFIERMSGGWDVDSNTVTGEGRDLLSDFIDSTLTPKLQKTVFNTPISIVELTKILLANIKLKNIKVSSDVEIRPFDDQELRGLTAGGNGFEFLERLCRLRQVLMTSDGLGNITFAQASKERLNTVLLHEIGNPQNNLLSGGWTNDFTNRFNTYQIITQANPITQLDFNTSISELVNREGEVSADEKIRESRTWTLVSSEATTVQTATNFAKWENNVRRAKSQVYTCSIEGFFANDDGDIWQPNKLVEVHDDFADVDSIMLINSVSFSQSLDETITTLQLISPDAFTPQPILTKDLAASNVFLDKFVSSTVGSN